MTELTLGPPPLVSCRESDNGHPCDHLPARSRAKMKIKFLRSERELKQVVVGCLQQSITGSLYRRSRVVIVTSPGEDSAVKMSGSSSPRRPRPAPHPVTPPRRAPPRTAQAGSLLSRRPTLAPCRHSRSRDITSGAEPTVFISPSSRASPQAAAAMQFL